MMLGFIIIIFFSTLCIAVPIFFCTEKLGKIITAIVTIIITIILIMSVIWYYNSTESGKRAIKDYQSNTSGGIERIVKVYDVNGNLIEQYKGKFDIDYDSSRIKFDDDKGKRHIIYYTTGTIIIDEL